jgi:metal-sulfur cluster biosynthetic enzyme
LLECERGLDGEEDRVAELADRVVEVLRGVYDPCCRDREISVVDMGLLHAVAVDGDEAKVELVLTTGWCPFVLDLVQSIQERVQSLPEIGDATVDVVWDEAWTSDRLSEDARRKLRFLPDPWAVTDRDDYLRRVTQ